MTYVASSSSHNNTYRSEQWCAGGEAPLDGDKFSLHFAIIICNVFGNQSSFHSKLSRLNYCFPNRVRSLFILRSTKYISIGMEWKNQLGKSQSSQLLRNFAFQPISLPTSLNLITRIVSHANSCHNIVCTLCNIYRVLSSNRERVTNAN